MFWNHTPPSCTLGHEFPPTLHGKVPFLCLISNDCLLFFCKLISKSTFFIIELLSLSGVSLHMCIIFSSMAVTFLFSPAPSGPPGSGNPASAATHFSKALLSVHGMPYISQEKSGHFLRSGSSSFVSVQERIYYHLGTPQKAFLQEQASPARKGPVSLSFHY